MSHKDIFEDSFDEDDSESGEDFSASEDEWKPGKDDKVSEEEDEPNVADSDEDLSDEEDAGSSKKKNWKKAKSKASKKITKSPKLVGAAKVRQQASLRSKLFRRYNPPPKTSTSRSPVPSKVADILSNSQYKERKQMSSSSKTAVFSDSDSSDDDGLVNPKELDFKSGFFDVKANPVKVDDEPESNVPVFDCNAGMNLSDSSDEDEFAEVEDADDGGESSSAKKPSIIKEINSKSGTEMHDFSSLQDFAKNLESAKAHLVKLKEKDVKAGTSKSAADESDITKLLSMGEGGVAVPSGSGSGRKRKHKDGQNSDDSDWENVSDNDGGNEIKDIQITVGNTAVQRITKDQKKAIDLEACLKRRLNRDIKQKQVWLHKSSVLCWIAHGNYINRVLNNMTLMEMCVKLLPSKNAYPKGDTDVKYYHMITEWFHSVFQLKSDKLYCPLKRLPPKTISLALQIQRKRVISKCDFVLLFVTMLRSIGLQCRLVINFAVPPQQPPQKDLFHISTKPKESEETSKKSNSDTKSLAKKIKVTAEKVKQSQKVQPIKSNHKGPAKAADTKPTKSSKRKTSTGSDHSYAEPSSSTEQSPKAKSIKSPRPKRGSGNSDHSYAEPRVKIELSRMSESFVEKNTAEPTTARESKSKEISLKQSSQSPSSKTKKPKNTHIDEQSNNSNHNNKPVKSTKTKEIGNAVTSTKSNDPARINGTPIKHKLVERTNSNATSNRLVDNNKNSIKESISNEKVFSPRKTRSKASKIADVAAGVKA